MTLLIKQISAVSVLFGLILSLSPEGCVKKMMNVLCSVILINMLAGAVWEFDFETYSFEMAKIKDREEQLYKSSAKMEDKLNRSVIQQQCEAYIVDKAEELGMGETEVNVTARWHSQGLWLPYSVEIKHVYNATLAEYIESELGVTIQMQKWG